MATVMNENVEAAKTQARPTSQTGAELTTLRSVVALSGIGGRQLVAASLRGRAHATRNGQREDSVQLQVAAGWNILALADGASPVQYPLQASNLAATYGATALAAQLWQRSGTVSVGEMREVMVAAVQAARDALDSEAERRKVDVRAFDTTLLLLCHEPRSNMVAVASIGDGALAALMADDSVAFLGHPTNPIRHLTATKPDDWRRLICVYSEWPATPRLFALFSDGVSNDHQSPTSKMGGLLRDLATLQGEAGPALLTRISYEGGSDDDRAAAVILPAPDAA